MFHGSVFTLALVNAATREKRKRKPRSTKKKTEQEIKDARDAAARGDKKESFSTQLKHLLKICFPTVTCSENLHLILYSVLLTTRVGLNIKLAEVGSQGQLSAHTTPHHTNARHQRRV